MQLRRTLATSTAVLALAVPLTSCGFDYATARDYTPAAGANDRSADVDVLNAVIVSGQEGAGTVVASIDNNLIEADQGQALVSLSGEVLDSGESLGAITATAFEPIEIAPGKLVNLAEPAANLSIQGPFAAGDFVSLSFEFASGQITELNVPVVVNDSGYWAGLDASGGGE